MSKIKVLMIDDNISLVEMVKEYFKENQKIELSLEAYNGEDGLNMILNKENEYDVILLDIIMPKKDGLYVLDELYKRNITKKIIVQTSYNAPDVIRKVSEYGVNYYILKPFDLLELEKSILEKYTHIDKLNRRIIDEFMSKILIGKKDENNNRPIKIFWNFTL